MAVNKSALNVCTITKLTLDYKVKVTDSG